MQSLRVPTRLRVSDDLPRAHTPRGDRLEQVLAWCLQSIAQAIASRPHICIIPMVLLALMVSVGVVAVLRASASAAGVSRMKALSLAKSSASALELAIQDAVMPVVQLQDWIKHTRNVSTILQQWQERLPDWFAGAPAATLVVQMAPGGRLNVSWPLAALDDALANFDLLDPVESPFRDMVIKSMQGPGLIAIGPVYSYDGTPIIIMQLPVFIPNVTESEMFGTPTPTDCPPGLCYNTNTRTRWWGRVATVLDSVALLQDQALTQITSAGYKLQIWRPPQALNDEQGWQNVDLYAVNASQPEDAITADLPVADSTWRLYVWEDNWNPAWKWPLIAVMVVVSVALSFLLFAVLLSWEEHRILLQSILPKDTIDRMRQHMDWHKAAKSKQDLKLLEIETPAQHMLTIIRAILANESPPISMVVAVKQALERSADVYRPANKDLRKMMKNVAEIDDEVQQALENQLAGRAAGGTSARNSSLHDTEHHIGPSYELTDIVIEPDASALDPQNTPVGARTVSFTMQPKGPLAGLRKGSVAAGGTPHKLRAKTCGQGAGLKVYNPQHTSMTLDAVLSADMNEEPPEPKQGTSVLRASGSGVDAMQLQSAFVQPVRPIVEQLDLVLATADSWQFDAYALEEATQGHPLSVLGYWLLLRTGCMEYAAMDGTVLARFLRTVESGYRANAYHNARHAADVLQTLHMIITQGGLMPGYVDPLTMLGCYLAAVVHDYEHLGRTNDFLVTTHNPLAVRYNDKSPMENHHLAAAWELLLQPEYNCLKGLSPSRWEKLRKLVIDLVLATDMRQHFAIVGQFSTLHPSPVEQGGRARSERSFTSMSDRATSDTAAEDLYPVSDSDKLLTLQVALKCADLGHLAAPLPVHLKWVSGLEEELFLQGDEERARCVPLSPLCDRTKEGVTKSQVGFFNVVVLPVFSHFCGRYTRCRPLLRAVLSNYHYWQGKAS